MVLQAALEENGLTKCFARVSPKADWDEKFTLSEAEGFILSEAEGIPATSATCFMPQKPWRAPASAIFWLTC